ncbi:hypothetical protein DTO207G8_372 [Paecilomyces variotii]|nr:hypothetical protein DTO032I3_4873 [Paecilomyces variotii]KAJ9260327.1 hypothetical protein DTO207G8_372 [Paecilomyces variotii]KAJ9277075.1 hypothetical protein DTO021D3_5972 [Paecilomyces variotii]KAJ9346345.1 hypothetical protein DTO027B6_1198 [Paecilomyces variotii]KAJ9350739.1 hypothetical protein DTO027B9_6763 [Paecilomyces variotii]
MEVASAQQHSLNHSQYQNDPNITSNTMDTTMDIDMDLDLGPLPEPDAIETEPAQATVFAEEGAVDHLEEEATYEKVHVRGVDELTTDDIKRFATEHFDVEEPSRIEWIDDTSANIVYSSVEVGLQALAALTQVGVEDASALPSLRLRSAKTLSSHPDSVLQVRSAVKTDRKRPRAHEASRFYLMHPEHDPRERLRRELSKRRHHGKRDDSEGDYTRRRFDDREHRRRRDKGEEEGFGAGMYDDEPADHSDADRGRGRSRPGRRAELFPDRDNESGRLRGRSASPGRDLLDEESRNDGDRHRRFRERSPQVSRRNKGRELFPSNGSDSSSRELFPNKTASAYIKKELFPTKSASNHRRSDAFDAADETAESLAKRITVPLVDGAQDQNTSGRNANVELFPQSGDNGVSIRGAAAQASGLSIRGAANGLSIKGRGASVRELFPSKYSNNAGKELFTDKLEGRGGRRRKAEDMFS